MAVGVGDDPRGAEAEADGAAVGHPAGDDGDRDQLVERRARRGASAPAPSARGSGRSVTTSTRAGPGGDGHVERGALAARPRGGSSRRGRRRSWFTSTSGDLHRTGLVVERGDEQRADRDVAGAGQRDRTDDARGRHRLAPLRASRPRGSRRPSSAWLIRPGSPPGRLSWYFSVPLMMRFLCSKKSWSGSSVLERVLHPDEHLVVLLQPVGDVEAERREVALVMAEQLVVQPDVGEVVDRGEAEPRRDADCLRARRRAGPRTSGGTTSARRTPENSSS